MKFVPFGLVFALIATCLVSGFDFNFNLGPLEVNFPKTVRFSNQNNHNNNNNNFDKKYKTQVKFWLYTRENEFQPHNIDINDSDTMSNACFVSNKPFIFLIQDFIQMDNITEILKPEILKKDNYNVIAVDYSTLLLLYDASSYPIADIGYTIAAFMEHLFAFDYITSLSNVWVIGYAFGAHIAGYISNYIISGKLEHITGLDPSSTELHYKNIQILNSQHARYVDVIHTSRILGIWRDLGTSDFYVLDQKACNFFDSNCKHRKVLEYYAESINAIITFRAKHCVLLNVFCPGDKSDMGFNVPKTARGHYYLTVNSQSPYAKG